MKKYLYIVALNFGEGEAIGFQHEFIEAEDDDDAYRVGYNTLVLSPQNLNRRMNDYVVELPR